MRNRSKVARHNAMLDARAVRTIAAEVGTEPAWVLLAEAVVAAAGNEDLIAAVHPLASGFHRIHPKARHSKRAGLGLRAYDARQQRHRADHGIDPAVIGRISADDFARFEFKPRYADLQFRKDGDGSLAPPAVRVHGEYVRYYDILIDDVLRTPYFVQDGVKLTVRRCTVEPRPTE